MIANRAAELSLTATAIEVGDEVTVTQHFTERVLADTWLVRRCATSNLFANANRLTSTPY
jgi:hypothetical protein